MSLRVSFEAGAKLLRSMGFRSEKVLAVPEKIQARLNGINSAPEGTYKDPEDESDVELLGQIRQSLDANEEIEVDGGSNGTSHEEEETPKDKKKGTKEKTEKTAKKASAGTRGKGNLDRFGCRVGGEPANINAVLTKKPQTAEVIAEKVGLTPERVNWQLKYYQREKGYVKLSDKGWALVPE